MISRLLPLILMLALLLSVSPTSTANAQVAERCFPETGQCIGSLFLGYWESHGGLAQQGMPLSGVVEETSRVNGKTYRVQYFERARFEYHPENPEPYKVLLGLLGIEQFEAKYGGGQPPAGGGFGAGAECVAFRETGKTACGPFLAYWRANGGLAQQGLPVSEVGIETSPTDGRQYRVQYFERARFEYHPGNEARYQVLLGLLGREQYQAKSGQAQPLSAPPAAHQPNASEEMLAEMMRTHGQQRRATLRYNPTLARVARERAADMAARDYFGHTNPDGLGPNALVRQAGYALPSHYGSAPGANNVESIGAGPSAAEAVWQLLLNSAGHRTHLLGLNDFYAAQVEYGIGYVAAPGTKYGHYWVIITAQPGP